MEARRYELIEAFGVRQVGGGSLIFPPGEAHVRATPRGCSMSIGNHEAVWIPTGEIERLVAEGVAVLR